MKEDAKVVVLDGGFATELEKQGHKINDDPLWSARFIHVAPAAVVDVHKRYIASGSDIITTASYQASIDGFQKHLGITEEESIQLIKKSVELAKQAISEYCDETKKDRQILIAGSVGPYGAAQADGSEYTGNYCDNISHEDLVNWHRPRLKALLETGVDLIAMETIPAVKEGEALMKLLYEFPDAKAWLSFSCQSDHSTVHGENIGNVAKSCAKIAPASQLIAIGVNCCPPHNVQNLLMNVKKEVPGFSQIAYPNSGEKWINKVGWVDSKEQFCDYISDWINASVKYIGGCCRTGPENIAEIVKQIEKCN